MSADNISVWILQCLDKYTGITSLLKKSFHVVFVALGVDEFQRKSKKPIS